MKSINIATLTLNPSIDHIITVGNLHTYQKNIADETVVHYGGKGINSAHVLGKLGASARAIAFMGSDNIDGFINRLDGTGVVLDPIEIGQRTRNTYKIIESSSGKDTEFNERGFEIGTKDLNEMRKLIFKSFSSIEWLLLCGSIPPGVPNNFYQDITEESHDNGVRVCLDSSGSALHKGIQAKPDILRINQSEIEEINGKRFSSEKDLFCLMDQLIDTGIGAIAVSLGAEGTAGTDGLNHWRIHQSKVNVVSTTGAGDAMTAGLVFSLSNNKPFDKALAFATALAAASTRKKEPGDFDEQDLEIISSSLTIELLKSSN